MGVEDKVPGVGANDPAEWRNEPMLICLICRGGETFLARVDFKPGSVERVTRGK